LPNLVLLFLLGFAGSVARTAAVGGAGSCVALALSGHLKWIKYSIGILHSTRSQSNTHLLVGQLEQLQRGLLQGGSGFPDLLKVGSLLVSQQRAQIGNFLL